MTVQRNQKPLVIGAEFYNLWVKNVLPPFSLSVLEVILEPLHLEASSNKR